MLSDSAPSAVVLMTEGGWEAKVLAWASKHGAGGKLLIQDTFACDKAFLPGERVARLSARALGEEIRAHWTAVDHAYAEVKAYRNTVDGLRRGKRGTVNAERHDDLSEIANCLMHASSFERALVAVAGTYDLKRYQVSGKQIFAADGVYNICLQKE